MRVFVRSALLLFLPVVLGLPAAAGPVDRDLALRTFDLVWDTVRETHFDSTLNGVDWDAVRTELRPAAEEVRTDDELRAVLWDMLLRLHQSHFGIISSPEEPFGDGTDEGVIRTLFSAVPRYRGLPDPGIEVRILDGEVIVFRVEEGGPADRKGVRPGWRILSIDGTPLEDSFALLRERIGEVLPLAEGSGEGRRMMRLFVQTKLAGNRGTPVRIGFEDGYDRPVGLLLGREPGEGKLVEYGGMPPIRVDVTARWVPAGSLRVAVVGLNAWLPPAGGRVGAVVDTMEHADGFVLDLRGNPGGLGQVAQRVAAYFFAKRTSLGTFRARHGEFPLVSGPQPRSRRTESRLYDGPLAILTDGASGSTSEVFTAGLLDNARARVIGERTAGAALPARLTPLPNGDKLLHATFDYIRPNGESVEGKPIVPDPEIPLAREDLLRGRDLPLEAALEWIEEEAAARARGVVLD